MARLIRHEATGPVKIDPATWPRDEQGNLKPIFVCACGLSQNFPFCDGAHKSCRASEAADKLYLYDRDRRTVIDTRDDA
ncbi:MAG: CDGSH iron-sulfur domain-containing protein [Phycisphaeraceae bacterium]|nr:CDGSH iron-sulfur domain-containing protein [Phycisphaeraceae bacterium]MBX3406261.1 CDGSH iron-sulfur domain-containing protein [Phycisphaeraceae bacterium]